MAWSPFGGDSCDRSQNDPPRDEEIRTTPRCFGGAARTLVEDWAGREDAEGEQVGLGAFMSWVTFGSAGLLLAVPVEGGPERWEGERLGLGREGEVHHV
jgi:hypothetical protein